MPLYLFPQSRISKEKMTIIVIKLLFQLLKLFRVLSVRKKNLRLFKVSNTRMPCVLFLLNECVLKFRIFAVVKKMFYRRDTNAGSQRVVVGTWGAGGGAES